MSSLVTVLEDEAIRTLFGGTLTELGVVANFDSASLAFTGFFLRNEESLHKRMMQSQLLTLLKKDSKILTRTIQSVFTRPSEIEVLESIKFPTYLFGGFQVDEVNYLTFYPFRKIENISRHRCRVMIQLSYQNPTVVAIKPTSIAHVVIEATSEGVRIISSSLKEPGDKITTFRALEYEDNSISKPNHPPIVVMKDIAPLFPARYELRL